MKTERKSPKMWASVGKFVGKNALAEKTKYRKSEAVLSSDFLLYFSYALGATLPCVG